MRTKEEEALVTMARPVVEEGPAPKTDNLAIRNHNEVRVKANSYLKKQEDVNLSVSRIVTMYYV